MSKYPNSLYFFFLITIHNVYIYFSELFDKLIRITKKLLVQISIVPTDFDNKKFKNYLIKKQ